MTSTGYKLAFEVEMPQLVKLDSALDLLKKDIGVHTALTTAAIAVQKIARQEAPVKTGRLVNSIQYKVNGLTAVIGPSVAYGLYVEMGTGLYGPKGNLIQPKSAKVLASKSSPGFGTKNKAGYFVIGTYSRGQEANPFMKRTVDKSVPEIEAIFGLVPLGISRKFTEL